VYNQGKLKIQKYKIQVSVYFMLLLIQPIQKFPHKALTYKPVKT